jgi:hypothetical protein
MQEPVTSPTRVQADEMGGALAPRRRARPLAAVAGMALVLGLVAAAVRVLRRAPAGA